MGQMLIMGSGQELQGLMDEMEILWQKLGDLNSCLPFGKELEETRLLL